jgi:flagellar motor switch protein FliN/FliY
MNPRYSAPAHTLAERWRDEFMKVMEAMADLRPDLEFESAPGPLDSMAGLLWWKQPYDLAPGATVWIGTAEDAWSHLGRHILTAAGIESAGPQEYKSTFLEVLRQSLGSLATVLGAQLGREIIAQEGAEDEPAAEVTEEFRFSVRVGDRTLPAMSMAISHSLLEPLSRRTESREDARSADDAPVSGEMFPMRPAGHGTLDLLLDVEMPVSVSFGRTQLRLQDVLKLITGSIVELDRAITEPVEVIVNNCVVARGEVVVVDGNYGVRISEIVSRRERLQQSRKYMLPAHGQRH